MAPEGVKMIESRKFVALAILVGLALIIAGLLLSPVNGSAHAASSQTGPDVAAERIGGAFAAISAQPTDAVLAAAVKGNFVRDAGCATATWPNIDASCLVAANGRTAPHVRTVTIGYQAGQSTTVLLRIPASEVAER